MTVDCPTCGDDFTNKASMRSHHTQAHGKSLCQIKVECAWCDNLFEVHESKKERSERLFCSQDCQTKYQRDDDSWRPPVYEGEEHPQYDRIKVDCEQCGDEIGKTPWRLERYERQFCSINCRAEWQSENVVGKDHHQYKGHPDYYGENWWRKRREAIEESGHCCEECGITEEQHNESVGRGLDVHHIIPIAEFAKPEMANTLDNLRPLCTSCHHQIHNKTTHLPQFRNGGGMSEGQETDPNDPSGGEL
jgi:5-methylcytosine-specific restriction endonuclease McrA